MKRKLVAVLLVIVWSLSAFAFPVTAQATSTKSASSKTNTTSSQKEAEKKPTVGELVGNIKQVPVFPFVTTLRKAELKGTKALENGVQLYYEDATEEDLSVLFRLCSYCGMYSVGYNTNNKDTVGYALIRPGSSYIVEVIFYPKEQMLIIKMPGDMIVFSEEQVALLEEYYCQELKLPTQYGPNVHPQFYASIGRTQADWNGRSSRTFKGKTDFCWTELYTDVDYATLHRYLSDMMLCGFEITVTYLTVDEDSVPNAARFLLDNGTSQIMVDYTANSSSTWVIYQSGIDRYLLSGKDYKKYIPQP